MVPIRTAFSVITNNHNFCAFHSPFPSSIFPYHHLQRRKSVIPLCILYREFRVSGLVPGQNPNSFLRIPFLGSHVRVPSPSSHVLFLALPDPQRDSSAYRIGDSIHGIHPMQAMAHPGHSRLLRPFVFRDHTPFSCSRSLLIIKLGPHTYNPSCAFLHSLTISATRASAQAAPNRDPVSYVMILIRVLGLKHYGDRNAGGWVSQNRCKAVSSMQ